MDLLRVSQGMPRSVDGRTTVVRCIATLGAVLLVTAILAPVDTILGHVNVVLLYLLLVLLVAARWGWVPGLFASLVANLAYNFFFVAPLHSFVVHEPRNLLALPVFLGVAALTSALLARARAGEDAERRRAQETAVLYELSRLVTMESDTTASLTAICQRVCSTFVIECCAVLAPRERGLAPVAVSGSLETIPTTAFEQRAAAAAQATGESVFLNSGRGPRRPRIVDRTGRRDRRVPTAFVPLRMGAHVLGVLQVVGALSPRVPTADMLRLLEAFADEAALALDRDRLLQEAAGARTLQETDRFKSALLAAVSHDLRTPLTTILASATSLLQTEVEWSEAARHEFLVQIEGQALRLNRLVGNLLDLSRIEGGAVRPQPDWYDVGESLNDIVSGVPAAGDDHPVSIEVAPDTGVARFDHGHLEQVMQNLLENAGKFSPPGSSVRVAARRLQGFVEVSVEDHGPGIIPEERQRIFDKFYRSTHATRRIGGSGLGLVICKGLVEANGGLIRAEEAPGGGARFVVSLPAAAV